MILIAEDPEKELQQLWTNKYVILSPCWWLSVNMHRKWKYMYSALLFVFLVSLLGGMDHTGRQHHSFALPICTSNLRLHSRFGASHPRRLMNFARWEEEHIIIVWHTAEASEIEENYLHGNRTYWKMVPSVLHTLVVLINSRADSFCDIASASGISVL